jgi:hypothetical protein
MNHAEVLNRILSHACPADDADADGFYEFYIETHCTTWKVVAKPVGVVYADDDYDYSTYVILTMEVN